MPPNTRASAISATALEKLEKERVPGRDSEVTVKEMLSPKMKARTNAAEPLIEAWAEGYSGNAGAPGLKKSSQGSHVGSASGGLRPSRIAVIARFASAPRSSCVTVLKQGVRSSILLNVDQFFCITSGCRRSSPSQPAVGGFLYE